MIDIGDQSRDRAKCGRAHEAATYLQPGAECARGPLDLVYYSLQLFVLDAAPMQSVRTLPLALQIARFAGPAVTIYLIFLAIQGLLAQRLYQARIRLTRGHSEVKPAGPLQPP